MLSIAPVAAAIAASRVKIKVADTEQGGAAINGVAGEFSATRARLRVAGRG
ncbi:hypothetical protein A2U01_0065509, partial [Trifolium medium]|nr:hypothetical protein [Trifolium medium]